MITQPSLSQIRGDLYLIELTPPITGFNAFIGAWVVKGEKNLLVDVGPAVTSGQLIQALDDLNIDHLDYILLTHIHIDHAGAIGEIAAHFPDPHIVCHPKGIPHLVDPTRLWQGTLKTLGETAQKYQAFKPVADQRFIPADQFNTKEIESIETLGHAPHHVSFRSGDYLFAGEAGGVCLSIQGENDYLRPATPPRFHFDVYLESVDRLLEQTPQMLCYGHFGITDDAHAMLTKHRRQLFLWKDVLENVISNAPEGGLEEACLERLLEQDELMRAFHQMKPPARRRERGFLMNSIKGFVGFLRD